MEKKLVRFTSFFTCAFSLFVCVAVWFLPGIEHSVEAFAAGILQDRLEREQRYAMLEKMSGLEIMDYNTKKAKEEAQDGSKSTDALAFSQQIRLELPKGTQGKDVEVTPDYVNRQVLVHIPNADKNYLYDYSMMGKSEGIDALDYFSGDGTGTIALTMSSVVETKSSYDASYFYLDFVSPKDIYDRVVVVDAGHGGNKPGATSGDKCEKDITLAIVKQLKALFDAAGDKRIGVYYTRLDDANPDFANRVGLANSSGADLFVSVHINSLAGNTTVHGTEVMYDELAEDTAFDTKDFAQLCLDEEVAALGSKNMGLIEGNSIYIIRNSRVPVALIEVGFMNNPNELANMLDATYQKKSAQGIYNAILKSLQKLDDIQKTEGK